MKTLIVISILALMMIIAGCEQKYTTQQMRKMYDDGWNNGVTYQQQQTKSCSCAMVGYSDNTTGCIKLSDLGRID